LARARLLQAFTFLVPAGDAELFAEWNKEMGMMAGRIMKVRLLAGWLWQHRRMSLADARRTTAVGGLLPAAGGGLA
jgi:hypothetical protein